MGVYFAVLKKYMKIPISSSNDNTNTTIPRVGDTSIAASLATLIKTIFFNSYWSDVTVSFIAYNIFVIPVISLIMSYEYM